MSFEYLADPNRPAWSGVLPGRPEPFFLNRGEGEHAKLFADTFTVLLSGDETEGQFGIFTADCPPGDIIPTHSHADTHETFYVVEGKRPVVRPAGRRGEGLPAADEGDFGFVPAGLAHAYRVEAPTRMLGVSNGGFERFFQQMGTLADTIDQSVATVHPGLPADAGRGTGARHAVHARLRLAGRLRWRPVHPSRRRPRAPLPPARVSAEGVRVLSGVPYAAHSGRPAARARPLPAADR